MKLKPCRKCGSKATKIVNISTGKVQCQRCGNEEHAKKWNTREVEK